MPWVPSRNDSALARALCALLVETLVRLLFVFFQGWCQIPTPSAAHRIFCPIASVPSDLCWSICRLFSHPLTTFTLPEPLLALTEIHFLLLPRLPQSYPSAWATESPSSACPYSQDYVSRANEPTEHDGGRARLLFPSCKRRPHEKYINPRQSWWWVKIAGGCWGPGKVRGLRRKTRLLS